MSIEPRGQPKSRCLCLSAVVPVVEVVAAVALADLLPSHQRAVGLVLDCDALFELRVVVLAPIASVHRNEHCVQFILGVLPGLEDVVWDASIVIEVCHSFCNYKYLLSTLLGLITS